MMSNTKAFGLTRKTRLITVSLFIYIASSIFLYVNKKFSVFFDFRILVFTLGCIIILFLRFDTKRIVHLPWNGALYVLILFYALLITGLGGYFMQTKILSERPDHFITVGKMWFNIINGFVFVSIVYLAPFRIKKLRLERIFFYSLLILQLSVILELFGINVLQFTPYAEGFDWKWNRWQDALIPRVSGFVAGPNIVFLVLFPYIVYLYSTQHPRRLLHTFIFLPLIILPQSKSGVIFYLLFFSGITARYLFNRYGNVILISAMFCFSILIYELLIHIFTIHTMTFRYLLWQEAFSNISDHVVFGYGVGFSRLFSHFADIQYGTVHNTYIALLGDLGIVGLIMYFGIILKPFRKNGYAYDLAWIIIFLFGFFQEIYFNMLVPIFYYLIPLMITWAKENHYVGFSEAKPTTRGQTRQNEAGI